LIGLSLIFLNLTDAAAGNPIRACDIAAAHPYDVSRPSDIVHVDFDKLDADEAMKACDAAIAAAPTHARAFFQAGRAHDRAGNKARAAQLYRRAVDLGHAQAASNLSHLYEKGEGVAKNPHEMRQLIEIGVERGSSDAMSRLASLYRLGEGVDKDLDKAIQLATAAAKAGHFGAMRRVGLHFYSGEGTVKDYVTARLWWEKSAAGGNAPAMRSIGQLYDKGEGVTQDYAMARHWYEKAAELGDATAMRSLAALLDDGRGGGRDPKAAKLLSAKADEIDPPKEDPLANAIAASTAIIGSAAVCKAPSADVVKAIDVLYQRLADKHPGVAERITRDHLKKMVYSFKDAAGEDVVKEKGMIFGMPCSKHRKAIDHILADGPSYFDF
jgi:TPR repeat protein